MLKKKGLKLSLVTNGLALEDISPEILSKFTWIRVSIQSEKYAEKIKIDHIPSTVKTSMSFIVHDEKSLRELQGIYKFAKKRDIVVRVAPIRPCSDDLELRVFEEVDRLGFPLISFQKEKGVPLGCYMLWLRAAIDWKGNFLPCPSIELSPEHFGKIPDDFGVCKISDLDEWLINTPVHDLGYRCSFCNCGKDTNDFIHNYFIKDVEDYEFV